MTEQPPVPPLGGYPPPPPPGVPQVRPWVLQSQPPPPGQPVGDLRRETYTSWIRRVAAWLIDALPLAILLAVGDAGPVIVAGIGDRSCTVNQAGDTSCTPSGTGFIIAAIIAVIFNLLGLAYWLWNLGYRQGRTGSSIGKSVLRFKVVGEQNGLPIGFGLSVLRQIAHVVDWFCGIGYLLPLFTRKRQTIADMIMGTVCLPVDRSKDPSPPARRGRRLGIAAGVVAVVIAIVAVLGFEEIGLRAPSRRVTLPFTGLNDPEGVAVDTTGAVYAADSGNNRVLKLPAGATTPTTLPFTGLNKPQAVAVDTTGAVYAADSGNNRVLKLPAGETTPTTLPFTGLIDPVGVAVDNAGAVYVATAAATDLVNDQSNNLVLKLAAGASTPTTLPFTLRGKPSGVAVDTAGTVYVAIGDVLRLRAGATAPDTMPFTVTNASFGGARGVAVDTAGTVYITDSYWERVVKLAAGSTTQVALPLPGLYGPWGVAVDTAGNVYVTDPHNNQVVKLPPR
jgi:streptogramin lyase/uncharacterized RDD family membrane protein YckC